MAYIEKVYYETEFKGSVIPETVFNRLADIASDMIDSLCTTPIDKSDIPDEIKRATAYQTEMLFLQGGIEAIAGMADGLTIGSESLGGYSVSNSSVNGSQPVVRTKDGIPVSSLAISLLKKSGYMSRWAYAEKYRNGKP